MASRRNKPPKKTLSDAPIIDPNSPQLPIDVGQRRRDYAEVFGSEAGRRVLADMMREFRLGAPMFAPGISRTEDVMHAEGGRNAVLYVLSQLSWTVDPQRFMKDLNDAHTQYEESA